MTDQEKAEQEAEKIKREAEQAQDYKNRLGAIQRIVSIDDEGNEHVAWFKKPSRIAVGYALAKSEENLVDACEAIFNSAIIQEVSDVPYFQQDEVFYGLIAPLQRMVNVKKNISTIL